MKRRNLELGWLMAQFLGTGLAGYSLLRPLRPHHWRHFAKSHATQTARRALKTFGAQLVIHNPERLVAHSKPGRLYLCNHHSYFDGLLIASAIPGIFVTSVEAQSDLVQGLFAKIAGSLFVERRSKSRLVQDIKAVEASLRAGFSVAIFPEGKTGGGEALLPFKSALLQAAIDAGSDVVPVCLNYLAVNDQPIRQGNCELIFYHRAPDFLAHFKRLLAELHTLKAELHILEPFHPQPRSDRRELAEQVRQSIQGRFRPISD